MQTFTTAQSASFCGEVGRLELDRLRESQPELKSGGEITGTPHRPMAPVSQ